MFDILGCSGIVLKVPAFDMEYRYILHHQAVEDYLQAINDFFAIFCRKPDVRLPFAFLFLLIFGFKVQFYIQAV